MVEQKNLLVNVTLYFIQWSKRNGKTSYQNYKSNIKFATYKQDKALPNMVHQYSSYLIKEEKILIPLYNIINPLI